MMATVMTGAICGTGYAHILQTPDIKLWWQQSRQVLLVGQDMLTFCKPDIKLWWQVMTGAVCRAGYAHILQTLDIKLWGQVMTGAICGAGYAHILQTPDIKLWGQVMTGATCGAGYAHILQTPDIINITTMSACHHSHEFTQWILSGRHRRMSCNYLKWQS